jgi:hypothetical protein
MTKIDPASYKASIAELPSNIGVRRIAAAIIGVVAWTGLVLNIWVIVWYDGMAPSAAIWSELRYFTIITNLIAAAIFTRAAFTGRSLSARASGGVGVPMLMVALVYWSVLYPQAPPPPEKTLVNLLVHLFTPLLVVAYHLLANRFVQRAWRDPIIWLCYPLLYLIYALVRGVVDGRFPYFFLDPKVAGWSGLILNSVILLLAFFVIGTFIMVLSCQSRPKRSQIQ